MSVQRMTRELRRISAGIQRLRLAASLIVLAIPLSGCGTGALWDKFMAKDDTFVEEPADKLYNEGLYLMNQRKDPKAASKKFEEVDRQHPYSEWARKSLLMSAYAFYNAGDYDSCIGAATRYVTLHPGSPAAALLGHNFPDSRWYKDAYNLVKSGGLEPSENKGSYISRAFKKLGLG